MHNDITFKVVQVEVKVTRLSKLRKSSISNRISSLIYQERSNVIRDSDTMDYYLEQHEPFFWNLLSFRFYSPSNFALTTFWRYVWRVVSRPQSRGARWRQRAHAKPLRDSTTRLFSRVVSRDEPWRGGRNIFYTIIKRLFCTGIFTETCKACSKTLKNVNLNLPDPNSKHSLEETILGFIPCLPESAASRHQHPPTQRIRCISLIKGEFQVEFALFQCRSTLCSAKCGNIIEFEV